MKDRRPFLTGIRDGARSERLTVFTDGAFAFAFTLSARRLKPPHGAQDSESDLPTMVRTNSATLPACSITFCVLSEPWMRLVRLFDGEVLAFTGLLCIDLVLLRL